MRTIVPKGAALLQTAKQYIQNGIINESDYAYSLGEVVAVLTVWTGDGSGTRDLENGIWASHRLDIATTADISDEEWIDVSETAVELLIEGTGQTKENGKRA